jgi:hypothetical protein
MCVCIRIYVCVYMYLHMYVLFVYILPSSRYDSVLLLLVFTKQKHEHVTPLYYITNKQGKVSIKTKITTQTQSNLCFHTWK